MVDLGAEVIKVELPPKGEHSRHIRIVPKDGKDGAIPSYFTMHNRGKKSICVDVKTPEGQAVIKDLIKKCDVLFENFTPGIMAHYGLTYDVVSQINPSIVMCSVSTYGQEGPYSRRIGNDLVALAAGGILHMMGEPDGYPPILPLPLATTWVHSMLLVPFAQPSFIANGLVKGSISTWLWSIARTTPTIGHLPLIVSRMERLIHNVGEHNVRAHFPTVRSSRRTGISLLG